MVGPPTSKKKHFFPLLLLLLSLSVFLFYSTFHSHFPPKNPKYTNNFFLNPHVAPNFTLTIKVLTYNRLPSLSRCLRSLAAARYDAVQHPINLHIFVDHFPLAENAPRADFDQKLKDTHKILDFVDGFKWLFGEKIVHYRTNNAGLQAQWLEAWWPRDENEFAFVVEDDLELSPLYYKFIRSVILNYYYDKSNFSPYVYGATLQRPRFVPGKHGNKLQLDSSTRLFLYQLVGTWGQLLFPGPWKEFRLWYDTHRSKGIKPVLEGMVTTGWYKRMGERIWTPWFIKFIHSRGYFNIYTNFLHERAFSTSHRDAGANYGKTAGPDSQLLDENSNDLNFLEMPPRSTLKWYDFCFREVIPNRVVGDMSELENVLHSVQKDKIIILVSLFGVSQTVARNLLCHFERLDIRNYILMGPNSDFLSDLARRGHPVIDVDKLFNKLRGYKHVEVQDPVANLIKENVLKAHLVKKFLELKYNSWVVSGGSILVNKNILLELDNAAYDFYIGKNANLFFVRSSPSSQKIMGEDMVHNLMAAFKTLVSRDSLATDNRTFVYFAVKLLEDKRVKFKVFDETRFALKIGTGSVNRSDLGDEKSLIYWSVEREPEVVQKRLEELGMWVIDGESSCIAVVCHRS